MDAPFGHRTIDMLCKESIKDHSVLVSSEMLLKNERKYNEMGIFCFTDDDKICWNGEIIKIKRLYVRDVERDDDGVGWVLNQYIKNCMVCNSEFGSFCWQHHCRACGNIICNDCSPNEVGVLEFPEFGKQRVCSQCCFGQAKVHAANLRLRYDCYLIAL